jgi:hypothetical protein
MGMTIKNINVPQAKAFCQMPLIKKSFNGNKLKEVTPIANNTKNIANPMMVKMVYTNALTINVITFTTPEINLCSALPESEATCLDFHKRRMKMRIKEA